MVFSIHSAKRDYNDVLFYCSFFLANEIAFKCV